MHNLSGGLELVVIKVDIIHILELFCIRCSAVRWRLAFPKLQTGMEGLLVGY